MRSLFRDRQERTADARRALVTADIATAAALMLFATDGLRSGPTLIADLLVLAWAAMPRLVASVAERAGLLTNQRRPRGTQMATLAGIAALGILATAVVMSIVPGVNSLESRSLALLLVFWATGFGLLQSQGYYAYDSAALLLLVDGIVRGAPHPLPFTGLALAALCSSWAIRRGLFGRGRAGVAATVNLQNARVAALLVAVGLVGVFGATFVLLRPILDGEGLLERSLARGRSAANRSSGPMPPADGGTAESVAMGRTDRLNLQGAAPGRGPGLTGIVARISHARVDAARTPRAWWSIDELTHFRAWVFTEFDPVRDEWVAGPTSSTPMVNGRGRVVRPAAPPIETASAELEIVAVATGLRTVLTPDFMEEVDLSTLGGAGRDLVLGAEDAVRREDPGFAAGEGYILRVRPWDVVRERVFEYLDTGTAPSAVYLAVPSPRDLGIDLSALAATIVDRSAALPGKVNAFSSWFGEHLRYQRSTPETPTPARLAEFLDRDRVGDCRHIATAATLLFRAAGVPARLVCGFRGAYPDASGTDLVIKSSSGHAWVEVLARDFGWVPLDPTDWVPRATPRGVVTGYGSNPAEQLVRVDGNTADGSDSVDGESGGARRGRARAGANGSDEGPSSRREEASGKWGTWGFLLAGALIVFWLLKRRQPKAAQKQPEEEPLAPAVAATAAVPRADFEPRTPAEHLLLDYTRLQEDLAGSGRERQVHETPREHATRLAPELGGSAPVAAFGAVVDLVDDGLYGQADLTADDLTRGRRALHEIRRRMT